MAKFAFVLALSLAFFFLFTFAKEDFGESLKPSSLKLKKEKLTHFKGYYQEVVSGSNMSSVTVVRPTDGSFTLFGAITMIDNHFTIGPTINSSLVGRIQGLYASTSHTELAYMMAMNIVFTTRKYNGSSLTDLGRNSVFVDVRDLPIIGRSGIFKFSRGYVLVKTTLVEQTTRDVTFEFNIYVLHY